MRGKFSYHSTSTAQLLTSVSVFCLVLFRRHLLSRWWIPQQVSRSSVNQQCSGPPAASLSHVRNREWYMARGDMEFFFSCSTWYLTSELRSFVRYRGAHEKKNSVSPSNHALFVYYVKTLLTSRSWLYSSCYSFKALSRADDVSAVDWRPQTHVKVS